MTDEPGRDRPVLAATVHDPGGHYLAGLTRLAAPLRDMFAGFGVLATSETAAEVVAFLQYELDARVGRAAADVGRIGRHRREAVRLAATLDPSLVLYSDLDHVLRWIETDPGELRRHVTEPPADLVVVGRTDTAMRACPRRLRDTEAIVNHIHHLATGRDWDLLFAVRAMSPRAAAVVVGYAREDSIANDVEWPAVVERAGLTVAYREADGLSYRITRDFDTDADTHDDDPREWIDRVEMANLHTRVLRRILDEATVVHPMPS
ncbi:MAG: hypothetical protein WCA46_10250 [Actinocatenispora sp.]